MAELHEPLSDRELDVLALLAKGASNKEIANDLTISPNTVKVHLRKIYTKLGVSSRTEATVTGVERGLITISGEIIDPDAIPPEPEPTPEPEPLPESTSVDRIENVSPPGRRWLWPSIAGLAVLVAVLALIGTRLDQTLRSDPIDTTESAPLANVQIDDTRWFVSAPQPDAVVGAALAASGVDLLRLGGELENGDLTDEVLILDTQQNQWRAATVLPEPVTEAGAAILVGEIYVVGGRTADGATAHVNAYSPSLNTWRPVADLPEPLAGGLLLATSGNLYYFGGTDGTESVSSAYLYDPTTDGWRALPDMPDPIAFAAGGIINGQAYLFGGETGTRPLATCHIFDLEDEQWTRCAPLSATRTRSGGATILDKFYLLGGETDATYGEVYDPAANEWQIINLPLDTEQFQSIDITQWRSPAITNIESRIFIVGGALGDSLNQETYFYAPLVYQSFIPATVNESESDGDDSINE